MAKTDFPLSIDRRHLLVSAAAITAVSAVPGGEQADAAAPDLFQSSPPTLEAAPTNFSAATARRMAQIAHRNEIRREADLPLLPIAKELRQLKKQEELAEFERFEAANGTAVLDEVLKRRREAEGPNWRPTNWMEGMSLQNQVREILWEQFRAARTMANVKPV
jgi:hypothetical protein